MTGLRTSAEHPRSQLHLGGTHLPLTYAPCPRRRNRSRGGWCSGTASLGGAPGPSSSSMSNMWSASRPPGSWTWPRTSPRPRGTSQAPPPARPACCSSPRQSEPDIQTEKGPQVRKRARTVKHGHPGSQHHSDRPLGWVRIRSTLQKHARRGGSKLGESSDQSLSWPLTSEALGESPTSKPQFSNGLLPYNPPLLLPPEIGGQMMVLGGMDSMHQLWSIIHARV